MSTEIVDERLLGALHLRLLDRAGFDHDPAVEHTAFQAGTLDALMAGGFDGDVTIGEVLAHGDLGIGTVEHLGGELVIVDGRPFLVDAAGVVTDVAHATRTPFAVVVPFNPQVDGELRRCDGLDAVRNAVDGLAPDGAELLAIRVDGEFTGLKLRSVAAQTPPYVSLAEVTAHQSEFTIDGAVGSLVGFRFPDASAGIEVPGYHLHFIADDRTQGGHVLDVSIVSGRVRLDAGSELHVELPAGVEIGEPGAADRAAIRAVEGG